MWVAAYSVREYLYIYRIYINKTNIFGGIKDSKNTNVNWLYFREVCTNSHAI